MASRKGCARALAFAISLISLASVAYSSHCEQPQSSCESAAWQGGHWCVWSPVRELCVPAEGMSYVATKAIQKKLNEKEGIGLRVDGVFGKETAKAIKDFQSKYQIPSTGKIDQLTHEKLFKK